MLVKAGEVVDKTIAALAPAPRARTTCSSTAATSTSTNTERRATELAPKGIRFFGMGVSGGEEGARHGPSMMPGGDRAGYDDMAPILTKIAAQVDDGPCVTYCGPGGAGHYVKMVHNGIEYGDMQLIAEAYDVLQERRRPQPTPSSPTRSPSGTRASSQSFLIEITAQHLPQEGSRDGQADLVDMIVDAAAQKGTGKWTVQDARGDRRAGPDHRLVGRGARSSRPIAPSARRRRSCSPGPTGAEGRASTRRSSSPTSARRSTRRRPAATRRG